MNADQWTNFYEFCSAFPDGVYDAYDPNDPCMFPLAVPFPMCCVVLLLLLLLLLCDVWCLGGVWCLDGVECLNGAFVLRALCEGTFLGE
jgi:hypothetical protein